MEKMVIKGTPQIVTLLKTKKKERLESIQKGDIFCKKLEYYINLEKNEHDIIVGDAWEASLPLRDALLILPEDNQVENIKNSAMPTKAKNNYVFCMTGINPLYDSNKICDITNKLSSLGEHTLIITDVSEFIDRITEASKKYGISFIRSDYVKYYNEQYDNPSMIAETIESINNIAFWKRNRYLHQSEYRFLFQTENYDAEDICFNIGDISDISKILTYNQIRSLIRL